MLNPKITECWLWLKFHFLVVFMQHFRIILSDVFNKYLCMHFMYMGALSTCTSVQQRKKLCPLGLWVLTTIERGTSERAANILKLWVISLACRSKTLLVWELYEWKLSMNSTWQWLKRSAPKSSIQIIFTQHGLLLSLCSLFCYFTDCPWTHDPPVSTSWVWWSHIPSRLPANEFLTSNSTAAATIATTPHHYWQYFKLWCTKVFSCITFILFPCFIILHNHYNLSGKLLGD